VFGLEELGLSLELQLLASVVLAGVAFASVVLVRRLRRLLIESYSPIVVDLISSVLTITIVVVTLLATADVWGQTETLLDQLGVLRLDERAPKVTISLIVLVAIQVFVGIATRLLDDLVTDTETLTEHQREIALRLTQVSLWGLGLLIVLGVWEVDLTGLLVGAGFLGIVVGLAARKTLGSLVGGFVLMFSRPFEVGDWIRVDEDEGTVSDITLMSTRIRGFDGEYIVVPNDVVTTKVVKNRTREGRFRAEIDVGVDYDTDVDHAREVVLEATETVAARYDHVRETPEPDVIARRLGDSSVTLSARVWIDAPTARRVTRVRDDLVCATKAACEDAGIKIPFPQRELSGREETGGFRLSGDALNGDGEDTTDDTETTDTEATGTDGDAEATDTDGDTAK